MSELVTDIITGMASEVADCLVETKIETNGMFFVADHLFRQGCGIDSKVCTFSEVHK